MFHKMLVGFVALGLTGCFPDGEIDSTGLDDSARQEAILEYENRAIASMEVEVLKCDAAACNSTTDRACLTAWECPNRWQIGSLLEGDAVLLRVRLTDQRFDPEPLIPLTQQKIVVALAGETGHRQTLLTDNDGFAATIISLENRLDSSCCKNTSASNNTGNLYGINVVFSGDDYYLPQEVVPHIELGPGTHIPKTQIIASGLTVDQVNKVVRGTVHLRKDGSSICAPGSPCSGCSASVNRRTIGIGVGNVSTNCSVQYDPWAQLRPFPGYYDLGRCDFELHLEPLPSGNYSVRIGYAGHENGSADACGEAGAVYNTSVRVINESVAPLVVPKGLFWGWDEDGAHQGMDPNTNQNAQDINGTPLSFGGTTIFPWRNYSRVFQGYLDHALTIKIKTLAGQKISKPVIVGIYSQGEPAQSCDPTTTNGCYKQSDFCPEGSGCGTPIVIEHFAGRGGEPCPGMMIPAYDNPAWTTQYCQTLEEVARFWKENPAYQHVLVGFRVGGGFDGEWVNTPIKAADYGPQCRPGSDAEARCDYCRVDSSGRIRDMLGRWSSVRNGIIACAARASENHQLEDGRKLPFFFESLPFGEAYQQNPMVGFKHNNFDEEGTQIAFGSDSHSGQNFGAYRRLFPDHFGSGESKYDTDNLSGFPPPSLLPQLSPQDVAQRRWSGAYWLSLSAIANRVDTFDFHSGVWELYRNIPGFDRFMNGHLGKRCGEASSGFVAFREVPPDRQKEELHVNLKYGTYGNFDHCLYAPYVEGTIQRPVRDRDLPLQAQSQYYVMGNKGIYYHSREVSSQYLYFDIDEELKRHTHHSHWKISVVYLDRGTDGFKIDYISASTGSDASTEIVAKQGTGRFVKKDFFISDLAAINSLPGSTDFALNTLLDAGGQGSEILHFVEATPIEIGKWTSQFSKDTGGWENQERFPRVLADVNGDGKADMIGFGGAGVFVALSNGRGFGAATRWSASFGADSSAGGWSSQNTYPRMLADVNKDGKADVVGFGGAGVYVALSTGTGFGPMRLWSPSFGSLPSAGSWTSQDTFPRMLADVNGDGRADILGFGGAGVYVSLSTGTGFGPMTLWSRSFGANTAAGGWTSQNTYPRMLADVNGDERADIIGFGGSGAYVSLSTGTGFGPMTLWSRSFGANPAAGGWSSQTSYPRLAADVNGDNKADIVGFGHTGVTIAYSLGNSFSPMNAELNEFGASAAAGGYASQNEFPRLLADVSGDGWADIVGINQSGVFVRISN